MITPTCKIKGVHQVLCDLHLTWCDIHVTFDRRLNDIGIFLHAEKERKIAKSDRELSKVLASKARNLQVTPG